MRERELKRTDCPGELVIAVSLPMRERELKHYTWTSHEVVH